MQLLSGSSPPVSWLLFRESSCSAVQLLSGSSPPVSWLLFRDSSCSAVQLLSGSSPPVSWLFFKQSSCSAVQLLSGSRSPVSWLLCSASTFSAVQRSSGLSPPVSWLFERQSTCNAVQPLSGSRLPASWLGSLLSEQLEAVTHSLSSAGSLSSGNGPLSPHSNRVSSRSTALHTAASPKVAAHVLFSLACHISSLIREQPAPSRQGTTRLATAGASVVTRGCGPCIATIERTRPCRAWSTTAIVGTPVYNSTTCHGT